MMMAVLELQYDDAGQTPYVLMRHRQELGNLLAVRDLAQLYPQNSAIVSAALNIAGALMRYFFVRGPFEQGALLMYDAASLALTTGRLNRASGLILQSVALAERAKRQDLVAQALSLADRLEDLTPDKNILSDIAMCRSTIAQGREDHEGSERHARNAYAGYRSLLRLAVLAGISGTDSEYERADINELHNDVSSALGLVGLALLSQRRFALASKAYRHSLCHQRGAFVAVNRGQVLHQMGNCEGNLGRHRDAALLYSRAARAFRLVEMEGYLSNALGELGYTLLNVDIGDARLKEIDDDLIELAFEDLYRDGLAVLDPTMPLDHVRCRELMRKLLGLFILSSLRGNDANVGQFCVSFYTDPLSAVAHQFAQGHRDRDEAFPLLIFRMSLQLGALVAGLEAAFEPLGAEDVPVKAIVDILDLVANSHEWAQEHMRLLDWIALLLHHRWRVLGAGQERLQEFVANLKDGVDDVLTLTRDSG
jgi:tetratricopeptide (TPR) repeat protein